MPDRSDLLQGTLDVLVLKILAAGPQHGWGISLRIQQLSEDVLQVNQGSLYPALYRLEGRGWIQGRWVEKPGQRSRRHYRLTAQGRKVLAEQRRGWRQFVVAMRRITGIDYA